MKATLNYTFERQSKNHLDWMIYVIKSEKYYEFEGEIMTFKTSA